MKVKKYNDYIKENVDLSYTDFFNKSYSHEEALEDRIKSSLLHILMDVKKVSEKNFSGVDNLIDKINTFFIENKNVLDEAFKMYDIEEKRISYIGEYIYDEYKETFKSF